MTIYGHACFGCVSSFWESGLCQVCEVDRGLERVLYHWAPVRFVVCF